MDTVRITPSMALASALDNSPHYILPLSNPQQPAAKIGEVLMLGRDPQCHVVVADPFVSSRHARIEKKSGHYIIRDLHSSNGTFLNGTRVTEASLAAHDKICLGESVFVFSDSANKVPPLESKNSLWRQQLERLPSFASTEFPILITGPSGSGKEILARSAHELSARNNGPFVSINCSALSESLIESELFGHVRGSFTGATHDRKGAFESARGGSLFLDEIGDLPITLQPKLLRAIENREIRPVGSDRTVETDVRVIAATHKNLSQQVQQGKFREDLYYRLNVCQIRPPRLQDRMEDFDDLFYRFAKQFRVRFSFATVEAMKNHPWNGNVRELKNTVARASAYFPGKHVLPEDLNVVLENVPEIVYAEPETKSSISTSGANLIKDIEREIIVRRLAANGGNQRQTALDLGIPKSTLHDRIKSYSIDVQSSPK